MARFSTLPDLRSALRSAVAAYVVFAISTLAWAVGPSTAAPTERAASTPSASTQRLEDDQKLLQVLNRFTYGPRPGDLEHLRTIGIKTWFDQQLAPQKIDDSALDRRLASYPAMQLPLDKLMQAYPDQQMLRKVMNGQAEQPGGEAEKAIYADSIARYKAKAEQKASTNLKGNDLKADDAAADASSLPQDAATLIAMVPAQRFDTLCKFTPAQLKTLRRILRPEQRQAISAGLTPQQFEAIAAFETPQGLVAAEDIQTKLIRDAYSERQLNEVMVDFWLNHFNVYMKKSQDAPYYISAFERDSIRPNALGKFESLLIAVASSPAMLNYLDNSQSVGPESQFANRPGRPFAQAKKPTGLNENYARELMELHTLGVNGGYTQKDVTEVAKVFTGWTVGSPERGGVPTQAQFDETRHEPGSKIVLGTTIKDDGEREGLEVLHLLATSPHTARFISTKLAVRFVSDTPPQTMVDRMTKTFLSSHGDIRKVLLTMVNSPEFFTQATYRAKVKTPQDFVISAVRASGAEVHSAGALANVIEELGMPVYGMQTPNGYSMKADPWNSTSSLIARLNFALALSTNRVVGVTTNWSSFLDSHAGDGALLENPAIEKEHVLESRLHLEVSDRTRRAILDEISADPAQQETSLQQIAIKDRKRDPLALGAAQEKQLIADPQTALAAGLLFGSPEFQRR